MIITRMKCDRCGAFNDPQVDEKWIMAKLDGADCDKDKYFHFCPKCGDVLKVWIGCDKFRKRTVL